MDMLRSRFVRIAWRWAQRLTLGAFLLVVMALLAGAVYQAMATRADARRFSPPGRMVSVGAHRLHLACTGTGAPTVVLDAPMGGSHFGWSLVQPEVARIVRVCAYDRAGLGWSDPGPAPRTSGAAVDELHRLLHNAGETPPFVLVGNSIGGVNTRLFAFRYPDEVAGLVLVDPAHEDQDERLPQSSRIDPSFTRLLTAFRLGARVGALRVLDLPLGEGSSSGLPPGLRPAARAAGFRTAWADALYQETIGLAGSYAEVRRARQALGTLPLGDLPLTVLTRGEPEDDSPGAKRTLALWTGLHRELVKESSRGVGEIVGRSGHFIQVDQPAAVVAAIRRMVEGVRAASASRGQG
jgi:pimeloyl-ACP methyl ester carboxylesterase